MFDELLALFARSLGFFLISPLFSNRVIPKIVRIGMAFVCSLLVAPPLLAEQTIVIHPFALFFVLIKELAIGYLLGFLFSLLIESAALAGQIVGTLAGFSMTELLDPLKNSSNPLIGRLFSMTLFVLFLALDFHHALLRFFFESFSVIPSSFYPFNAQVIQGIIEGMARLFQHTLAYASFPLLMLLLLILLFAITSRFLPYFNIFWIGFPIQLLIGFGAIAVAMTFFTEILTQAFNEFFSLAKKMFFPL